MLISRRCAYAKADGQPCRMAPLHDRPYCFSHDPERAEEAAEARRIGGLRRKKEGTIDYGNGTTAESVAIVELRDGKVVRQTDYFAAPFEAPEWRKPFRKAPK